MAPTLALLRGVNVGGKGKVDMAALRTVFEAQGLTDVRTYLNTGNVVFRGDAVASRLERAIAERFDVESMVLLRTSKEIDRLISALPAEDPAVRCDVVFLAPDVDRAEVLDDVPVHPVVEEVRYVPGALIRTIAKADMTKGRLGRIAGTPLYARISIRSAGTVRRIRDLMTA